MGVKGLSKLINGCLKTGHLKNYTGKAIGIDTSLYMHKFGNAIYSTIDSQEELSNKITYSFKNFNTKLIKQGVTPLFIFDTKSNDLKKDLIEKRQKSTKVKVIHSYFYKDLRSSFIEESISFENSPELWEAEQYGAFLTKADKIAAFVTADLDCLAFGGTDVITKINRDNSITYYNLKDVLEFLNISHEKFVLMCIMMGTDFSCKGVPNYGPKKSLKYVQEHELLEIKDFLRENLENEFETILALFNQTLM